MSLDADGHFTYVLDSEVMGCVGTMTGSHLKGSPQRGGRKRKTLPT
jgi:hypothetical protein